MTDALVTHVSPADLARRWTVSEGFVRAECRAGRLPFVRLGTLIRIALEDADAYPDPLVTGVLRVIRWHGRG